MSEADITITVGVDAAQEFVDFAQDRADGAALRRLREALPEGWSYTMQGWPDMKGTAIEAWDREGQPVLLDGGFEVVGDTIAKAADKCCEALG